MLGTTHSIETIENPFNKNTQTNIISKFNNYYTEGLMETINLRDIPKNAMKIFEGYSARFISEKIYHLKNFNISAIIHHDLGYDSYLVSQLKEYFNKNIESEIYIVETNRNKEIIGKIELRYNINNNKEYWKNKPFVGFTETFNNFREGFGIRRLYYSNAITHAAYNLPLHSDTILDEKVIFMWEKLVNNNEAIKYKEGKHDRYKFKI